MEVAEFLGKKPNPSDEEFHKWVEGKGYKADEVEGAAYRLATTLGSFLFSGRAKDKGIESDDVDQGELSKGISIEMEHTDCRVMAERIAMDHLAEFPDYYTRLIAMEKEAEGKDMKEARIARIAKKVVGGTWSLPDNAAKVTKLVKLVKMMKAGKWVGNKKKDLVEDVEDELYPLVGDDDLFDNLGYVRREETVKGVLNETSYLKSVGFYVESFIEKLVKNGPDNLQHKKDYDFIIDVAKQLGVKV